MAGPLIPAGHRLGVLLESLDQILVVRGPVVGDLPDLVARPEAVTHRRLTDGDDVERTFDAVLLVVRDRLALRQVVGACRGLPASTRLGCVLLEGAQPPLTTGRPTWPRVRSLTAAADPLCFTLAEFEAPVDAAAFFADLARRVTPPHLMSAGWPVVGSERSSPGLWTPADPTSLVGSRDELADTLGDYPPDVLLLDTAAGPGPGRERTPHHVLGPLAEDVRLPSTMTWSQYDDRGAAAVQELAGVLGLGAVDEQLVNPTGFRRTSTEPIRCLEPGPASRLTLETMDGVLDIDSRQGVGEEALSRLRALEGVHLSWSGAEGPRDYCRVVVELAMAGVPLTCEPVPGWAHALIDAGVLDSITATDEDSTPQSREVRSIRTRRAAHRAHSRSAWRRELALRRGLQVVPPTRVSILLPTRRPQQLRFALRQVARQRDVDVELVLATHGHPPDRDALDELTRTSGIEVTCVEAPEQTPFGDLLNEAARRATGDVLLKMDDDDWYGPDFVTDLLLARAHSGADVVGCPPEFIFVEQLGLTVRRRYPTERFGGVVAGGTMVVSRDAHDAVGGFRRMRRYVDAGFQQAIAAAGGVVYRAHGHGYVLRRAPVGHTWDPGVGYFLSRARVADQWRGFRPSPLLEPDPVDAPDGALTGA